MSQLKITNAGVTYKDEVFAGQEVQNITHFLFCNVPGLLATDVIDLEQPVPTSNIVHTAPIKRVSRLNDNAVVISATLGYDIGDFDYNWYGAVATKADGSEVLIAVVHTPAQTKTKTNGAISGNYSVKSILWRTSAIAQSLNVSLSTLPWQVNDGEFVTRAAFDAHGHTATDIGALSEASQSSADLGYGPDLNEICDKTLFCTLSGSYDNTPLGTTASLTGQLMVLKRKWNAGFSVYQQVMANDRIWWRRGSDTNPVNWTPWYQFYSEANKPNAADVGVYSKAEVDALRDSAINYILATPPETLDTLNELAAALGDDPNFATTITNLIATKLDKTATAANAQKLDNYDSSAFGKLSEAQTWRAKQIFDSGISTTIDVLCDDSGMAEVRAMGASQGTGRFYAGQSPTYGGGIEYNGDGTPTTVGAGADFITLFRRSDGVDYWTARNSQSNNNWEFRNRVTAASFYEGGNRVYSPNNKPTPAGIGALGATAKAADAAKLDGRAGSGYFQTNYVNGYNGMMVNGNNSSWIRTTSSGIIPFESGGASAIGSSGWPFNSIYGITIYENGASLASKYLAKTARAADTEKVRGLSGEHALGLNAGATYQDPNLADMPVILTKHGNGPDSTYYYHITTTFYSIRHSEANRGQIAVRYSSGEAATYSRAFFSGVWTAWRRLDVINTFDTNSSGGYSFVCKKTGFTIKSGKLYVGGNSSASVTFTNAFTSVHSAVASSTSTNVGHGSAPTANATTTKLTITNTEGNYSGAINWVATGYTAV